MIRKAQLPHSAMNELKKKTSEMLHVESLYFPP